MLASFRTYALAVTLALAGCADREGGAPIVSLARCAELGGEPTLDPGDGSAFEQGCGEGLLLLGYLDPEEVGDDGGICCE